jgi:hypothetical protein
MVKRLWEAWKRLAHRIGNFQARLVLTVLYALLVAPFGLGVRLFSDPLHIKRRPTKWVDHPELPASLEQARKQ